MVVSGPFIDVGFVSGLANVARYPFLLLQSSSRSRSAFVSPPTYGVVASGRSTSSIVGTAKSPNGPANTCALDGILSSSALLPDRDKE
jgi:hypothetical protein